MFNPSAPATKPVIDLSNKVPANERWLIVRIIDDGDSQRVQLEGAGRAFGPHEQLGALAMAKLIVIGSLSPLTVPK